ncbi:MAG: NAD-dependent succinate-semialdehyde dehydrogenase [Candidatus Thermoplasmatota archaeon]|nr:NAD-dependent succinate-semialdehyde dehydrogenase [Candidatus Thermoplasmatota archaeon]
MTLTSINPTNGTILKEFEEWDQTQIEIQIKKTQKSFTNWKGTSHSDKSDLLKKVSRILREDIKRLSTLISMEMGKPILQSEYEIEKCARLCEYYATYGKQFLKNENIESKEYSSYIQFLPLGIVLIIMPWNFPFWQVFRCAVPSLVAGNVVLLKHASNVPQCGYAIEDIFLKAGFQENVFSFLPISSKLASNVITDDRIAALSFTGSTSAGSHIASLAGKHIKKIVLELGGSDPFIVLDDVDLNETVKQAVKARIINNGQSCIAAKRFIVQHGIFHEFQELFKEEIERLIIDDPLNKSTDIGPLATEEMLNNVDKQVHTSVKQGAKLISGVTRLHDRCGFFYQPTVLTCVSKEMPIMKEETFGPVAPLIKVKNEKEALEIANDSCYGLGASIWTNNITKAKSIAKQVQAGNVFINDIVKSDPSLPFGGIKQSGFGRELSHYGIKEFVNIQSVCIRKH